MKRLIINADDFGMSHAINLGIVESMRRGVVTQTSIMVPCPWFEEAIELAKTHQLPMGIHLTATCEWSYYRWRPLTNGSSLVSSDGTCHSTVAAAKAACDPDELEREFAAQIERVLAHGIQPQHLDVHMGMVDTQAYLNTCARFGIISIAPDRELDFGWERGYQFTSSPGERGTALRYVSQYSFPQDKPLFMQYLDNLGEGVHFTACHPAVDSDEVAAFTSKQDPAFPWARDIRVSDLAMMTDGDVRARINQLGIQLTTCGAP
jgi:predicted glycoside hydrolase/deacetylase ChbG (UPF0249 family)